MRKRILAFFLTLCIVLSMLPIMAFAEEVGGEETTVTKSFSELLEDSETTQIKLTQNEMVITTVRKSVEIDLNGFTLSGTIMVADGNVITIKDSEMTGELTATMMVDEGELLIKSVGLAPIGLRSFVSKTSRVEQASSELIAVLEVKNEELAYKVNGELYYYWADAVAAGNVLEIVQNAAPVVELNKDLIVTVADGKTFDVTGVLVSDATMTITNGSVKADVVNVAGSGKIVLDGANVKMMQTTAPIVAVPETLVIKSGYYAFDASAFLAEGKNQVAGLVVDANANAVAYIGTTGYETLAAAIEAANGGKTIVLVKDVETTLNIASTTNVVIELNGFSFKGDATILNYGTIILQNELGENSSVSKLINMGTATLKSGVFSSVENGGTLAVAGTATINTMSNTGALKISGGSFAETVAATLQWPTDFVGNAYLGEVGSNGFVPVVEYEAFIVNGEDVVFLSNAADVWTNAALVDGAVVYLYADVDNFALNANVELVLAAGVEVTNVTVNAGYTLTVPYGNVKYTYGAGVYAAITAPVAVIGDVYYMTIQDAVAAAKAGETITLVGTAGTAVTLDGDIILNGKKNFTLDLNGMDVSFDTTKAYVVGIVDGSTLVLKNGTLNGNVSSIGYLTFDNVTVNGTVSINRCTATFTNGASINAPEGGVALAVKTLAAHAANQPAVVFDATTGTVNGDITVNADAVEADLVMSLTIAGGTFSGEVLVGAGAEDALVAISGGLFTGIENYEAFYLFCRAADMYPELKADGSYVVAEEVEFAASISVGKDRVEYSYYTVEDAVAAALAFATNVTITLKDDYTDVLVIEDAKANITLNLGKYNLGGIEFTSAVEEDGTFYTLTVNANHSGTRAIKGTIVVNAGKVVLDSAKLNVNVKTAAVFQLNAENAFATIANVNVTKCGAIAEYAEGVAITNLVITGGTFPVQPAYENVADAYVIEAGSKTWTVKLTNPTAAVYDAEGNEYARYATFAEAVQAVLANADLAMQIRVLKNDPFAEYVLDLPAGVELLVINEVGADIKIVTDTDTFTRFDAANSVYYGYTTYAIVNGNVYCKDQAEVNAAVAEGNAIVAITNNIDALTIDGSLVAKLTVAKGKTINTLTVEKAALLVVTDTAELTYNPGAYNKLAYAAYVAKNVYATIDDAIATGAALINVAIDGPFTVEADTITLVFGDTTTVYGIGEYENLADADAKVGDVLYATIEDAIEAMNTTTDTLSIYLLRDVLGAEIEASEKYIYIYGEGHAIGALALGGNKRVSIANAVIGALADELNATLILNEVVVELVESTASALYLRGATMVGILELQDAQLVVDQAKTVTVLALNLAGNIGLTVNNSLIVGEFVVEEVTFTTTAITGGVFYGESIEALKAAVADGYAFTKCVEADGVVYFKAISLEKIVAEVDGVLYEDFKLAAVEALAGGFAVKALVKSELTLDAKLNKITLTEDSAEVRITTDAAHYVAEADGTYTYELLVAVVDGVNFNNAQAAIDYAIEKGVKAVIYVDEKVAVPADALVCIEYNGKTWILGEGKFGFEDSAFFTPVASTGSKANIVYYNNIQVALAANAGAKTTITLLADVDTINVEAGSYTFAMNNFTVKSLNVKAGTVAFSGIGTVGYLNVDDGKVSLSVATLTVLNLNANGGMTTVSNVTVPAFIEANEFITMKVAAYVEGENTITYYSAVTSVKEGTLVLLADVTKATTIKYDVTIDLNGYTFNELSVYADKNVTVTGEGKLGVGTIEGNVDIASTDIAFNFDPLFRAGYAYTFENSETFCTVVDEEAEDEFIYVFAPAAASLNGMGFASFEFALEVAKHLSAALREITLYEDTAIDYLIVDEDVSLDYLEIDLNGHTLTVDVIIVVGQLNLSNGTIAVGEALEAALIIVSDGHLSLDNVTVELAKKYDEDLGVKASIFVEGDSCIEATDSVIDTVIYDNGCDANIIYSNTTIKNVYKKGYVDLHCGNHNLENGKCSYCGEVAKKVILPENVFLTDIEGEVIEPVDGVYYFFKGAELWLNHGTIPAGYYFSHWDATTTADDHYLSNAYGYLVIGSADITIEMVLIANDTVDVVINAPLFSVTGLSGMQLGAATVSPVAGTDITITYEGAAFLANSAVVYWVNENGMIVGKGNTITLTISAATTLTAICDQGAADNALVVYRNGADKVGTKILSYVSVAQGDLETLVLHANASIGALNVVGWKIAGTEEVLTNDTFRTAVAAAIANGTVLYLEPAVEKTTVDVEIYWGKDDEMVDNVELDSVVTVFAGEYAYITAPVKEGYKFLGWLTANGVLTNKTLVYKFTEDDFRVIAIYAEENDDDIVVIIPGATTRLETEFTYGEGKIYLNGIFQIPEGCTMVEAGIIYSTVEDAELTLDGENVKVKKVSGLEGKENVTYNLTLNTTKDEVTVYACAFITYVDANGVIQTVYSDVEVVDYSINSLK